MKFRCGRDTIIYHFISSILLFAMEGIFLYVEYSDCGGNLRPEFWIAWFLILFLCMWYLCTGCIYYGKEIHITQEGCFISLLGVKKFYAWDSYKDIRFQKGRVSNLAIKEGENVLVFTSKLRRRNFKSPYLYCICLSPFKSFCLGFYSTNRDVPKMFSTDHNIIDSLQEWGVEIQNREMQDGDDGE